MSSMSPAIACFIDLQDQVLVSSCPSEMVVLSERGGRVSCACPPRHGQKKAAFACEGLRSPGTEQVLLMLKATIPPVLCHDHRWIQILRGRNLNYLRSLHHEKEHECSIRYRALEGALRIKLR